MAIKSVMTRVLSSGLTSGAAVHEAAHRKYVTIDTHAAAAAHANGWWYQNLEALKDIYGFGHRLVPPAQGVVPWDALVALCPVVR